MALFYEDVLRALNARSVRYVLVGGTAVILHGVPRTTADIDIVPELSSDNLLALVAALTNLGFRPRAPVPAEQLADPACREAWIRDKDLKAFSFYRPSRPLDAVDVLIDAPLDYAALDAHGESLDAGGLPIRIAAIRDLIVLKRHAGRAQDLSDIDALERLEKDRHG
jgi:hypothetical protein